MVLLQPGLRAAAQFHLLGDRDAVSRRAETASAAAANLDKHPLVAIPHDQVDFAEAAGNLPGDQREPRPLQMRKREVFADIARALGR